MSIDTIVSDTGEFERIYPGSTDKMYIVDNMPDMKHLPDGSLLGYYSVTLPNKKRIVPIAHTREWEGEINTETSFTRQFMKTLPRRRVRREEFYNYLSTRPPVFLKPGIIEDAVYIDIRTAYPSIYKNIGWMTDYVRGKYWGSGETLNYPYPMTWKAGRSYVISGSRHNQFGRYIYNGQVKTKKYFSPYSNPPLVAGVYDVLSCCARFSQYALQAKYWNVDGGIMPEKATDIFLSFLQSIGLEGRIKYRGYAVIMSTGYWKVGDKETINFSHNLKSRAIGGDWIPVNKMEAEWIYNNYRKIVERKTK